MIKGSTRLMLSWQFLLLSDHFYQTSFICGENLLLATRSFVTRRGQKINGNWTECAHNNPLVAWSVSRERSAHSNAIRYKTIRRRLYDNPFKPRAVIYARDKTLSLLSFVVPVSLARSLALSFRYMFALDSMRNENGNENKSIYAKR